MLNSDGVVIAFQNRKTIYFLTIYLSGATMQYSINTCLNQEVLRFYHILIKICFGLKCCEV